MNRLMLAVLSSVLVGGCTSDMTTTSTDSSTSSSSSASSDTRPISAFKSIAPGSSLEDVRKQVAADGLRMIKQTLGDNADNWDAVYRLAPGRHALTIAGHQTKWTALLFVNTAQGLKLDTVIVTCPHSASDKIFEALQDKYGKPDESFPNPVHNAFGATFDDVLHSWRGCKNGYVSLETYGPDKVTECQVKYGAADLKRLAHIDKTLKDL